MDLPIGSFGSHSNRKISWEYLESFRNAVSFMICTFVGFTSSMSETTILLESF